jgi:hypothetical protein
MYFLFFSKMKPLETSPFRKFNSLEASMLINDCVPLLGISRPIFQNRMLNRFNIFQSRKKNSEVKLWHKALSDDF